MALSEWLSNSWRNVGNASDPRIALKNAGHELWIGVLRRVIRDRQHESILSRDNWDICCVLDGCRADLFAEVASEYDWLPNQGQSAHSTIWSVASSSNEWITRTFDNAANKTVSSVGYVTGNLFAQEMDWSRLGVFYQFTDWQTDGVRTVGPRPLTDSAITIWRDCETHKIDRLVVHYMQPHTPFRSRPEWFRAEDHHTSWGDDAYLRLRDGDIDHDEWWDAYSNNLRWVLDDVNRLRQNCDARIAITADHGNGLGEWGVYAHPAGVAIPELRKVPWVMIDAEDHKTVDAEIDERATQDLNQEERLNALKHLGYA